MISKASQVMSSSQVFVYIASHLYISQGNCIAIVFACNTAQLDVRDDNIGSLQGFKGKNIHNEKFIIYLDGQCLKKKPWQKLK